MTRWRVVAEDYAGVITPLSMPEVYKRSRRKMSRWSGERLRGVISGSDEKQHLALKSLRHAGWKEEREVRR